MQNSVKSNTKNIKENRKIEKYKKHKRKSKITTKRHNGQRTSYITEWSELGRMDPNGLAYYVIG